MPHQITGDFDSIKPEIKQYYEALGIKCQHDPCQDSTDLNKSMKLLFEKIEENSKNKNNYEHKIVITGCLGSRFDHNLCNLSSLLKYTIMLEENKFVKKFSIQIIHDHSIITCIMPGKTNYIRSNFFEKCEDVGLFPLTGPCKRIETKGLKWNLGLLNCRKNPRYKIFL